MTSSPSTDLHRPHYHLMPSSGWLNDPNGLIQWRGRYHLFYQHNPHRAVWGPPSWGHAVSDDLVRWEHWPLAITPEMTPEDPGGCWSGCAVDDNGTPTLLYTGVSSEGVQRTCLAVGDDTLRTWHKYEGNPVATRPEGVSVSLEAYRDPFVWRDGETWYQLIGSSLHRRGRVLLSTSTDLRTWTYRHPLLDDDVWRDLHDNHDLGGIWECPNLLPFGDKHLLIVGVWTPDYLSHSVALVGTMRQERFYPTRVLRFDHSHRSYYAPQLFKDNTGRWIAFGWLQEQRDADAQLAAGWSGVMSLPRVVSLDEDDSLSVAFAPELQRLRDEEVVVIEENLSGERTLDTLRGRRLELHLTLYRQDANRVGIVLLRSPDGEEQTRVFIDWTTREVVVEKGGSSLSPTAWTTDERGSLEQLDDTATIHLYLDHSTLELIVNGRDALATRLYPTKPDADTVALFAEGGPAKIHLHGWTLKV